jgi:hypothetical protein
MTTPFPWDSVAQMLEVSLRKRERLSPWQALLACAPVLWLKMIPMVCFMEETWTGTSQSTCSQLLLLPFRYHLVWYQWCYLSPHCCPSRELKGFVIDLDVYQNGELLYYGTGAVGFVGFLNGMRVKVSKKQKTLVFLLKFTQPNTPSSLHNSKWIIIGW